jgi:hypothetical protein
MKIFSKAGHPQQSKLQKRVASIGTSELIVWVENALYVIGKEVTHHQRDRNIDSLYEAKLGAEALLAITEELIKRAENG